MVSTRSSFAAPPLCALLVVAACRGDESPSLDTDTRSGTLHSEAERVAFLSRYVGYPSAVEAAEFHVSYHDNSGGCSSVPGPSDYLIEAAIKVAPQDVALWVAGLEPLTPEVELDLSWGVALIPTGWSLGAHEPPVVYQATRRSFESGSILAVYPEAGIVLERRWAY